MMSPLGIFILLIVIALPIAWFISEFRWERRTRLVLGCLTILCSFGVAFIVGLFERMNSNAWFGYASKQLIEATVSELEAGRTNQVLQTYRQLQSEFHPTYENRARYDKLVERAVSEMKGADTNGQQN